MGPLQGKKAHLSRRHVGSDNLVREPFFNHRPDVLLHLLVDFELLVPSHSSSDDLDSDHSLAVELRNPSRSQLLLQHLSLSRVKSVAESNPAVDVDSDPLRVDERESRVEGLEERWSVVDQMKRRWREGRGAGRQREEEKVSSKASETEAPSETYWKR